MNCQRQLAWDLFYRIFVVLAAAIFIFPAISKGQAQPAATTNTTVVAVPTRTVGGVAINPEGLLENVQTDALGQLARLRAEALKKAPADLNMFADSRKVSLRRLEAAIEQCAKDKKPLPDDIRLLAGLQQIRYVFVYPEQKDIILVGPGEGWKVDARGNVVGITTGRPVMLLDDLLVALRTARAAAQGGITCSIEPTPEGLARYNQEANALKKSRVPQAVASEIERLLGMQQILVEGVPATSHFAQVLVAADYRMKRLGMNFDQPPKGIKLPSYLSMLPGNSHGGMFPRFWLEPQYEPLLKDASGLAWELRGASVKALTEEDFLNSTGLKQHSGKASPLAQKWADNMTKQFPALAVAEPVFGDLRNCMELAVVGALIVKESLTEKAGYSMPVLMNSQDLSTAQFNAPKQVPSVSSVLKKGNNWIISVSGGVAINSWFIADKTELSDTIDPVRTKATPADDTKWWWN